jgi:polyphosphate kinase
MPDEGRDTTLEREQRLTDAPREMRRIEAKPELFFNRELSWLEFNQRVLDEARDPSVPLLERLKFLAICANNLDEFFMVRVSGLLEQRTNKIEDLPADGMTATEQLAAISSRTQKMIDELAYCIRREVLPALAEEGVDVVAPESLSPDEIARLRVHFLEHVYPILTPLAIDPGHPFPHVPNRALYLIVMLSGERSDVPAFAVVQVPAVIPRVVPVPGSPTKFVLLDELIAEFAGELFRGFRRLGAWSFRVIRDFDLSIDEDEAEDLLESIKAEVRMRDRGNVVRLSVDAAAEPEAVTMLVSALNVDPQFVFRVDAPLALQDLVALGQTLSSRRDLRDRSFTPVRSPAFAEDEDVFEAIARGDVLLHHPYESFDPVVELLERAAADPDVLAIKQTLYRTSGDSPIVKALVRAAEHGKQVTALVEIKARFDEENNIAWARRLEEAGVHVVYGLVGLKTHAKVLLVVRRESGRLRRYVHLGTGNYNPSTARLYTDLSLFTARPEVGEDATALFNLLTSCTAPESWHALVVAPLGLHERVLALIEREAQSARAGRPARIIAKMNSLVDPDVILALYRASQAGVRIELLVRGICCLRPGIPGVSDRIEVLRVVDRFLEHTRAFYFEADGRGEVYASSADWMPRNFLRRVEVMFPIVSEPQKRRVLDEVLSISLMDRVKSSRLMSDGSYVRLTSDDAEPLRSQRRFLDLAIEEAKRRRAEDREARPFVVRPVRQRPSGEKADVVPPPPPLVVPPPDDL